MKTSILNQSVKVLILSCSLLISACSSKEKETKAEKRTEEIEESAIFVYVGVEVATAGNLGEYLKSGFGMTSAEITPYVSLYWASLMIGRWTSAANVFSENQTVRSILRFILPYGAFGVFILINSILRNINIGITRYNFFTTSHHKIRHDSHFIHSNKMSLWSTSWFDI